MQVNELEDRIKAINKQIEELLLEQEKEHEQYQDRKSKIIQKEESGISSPEQLNELQKKLNVIRDEDSSNPNLNESLNWLLSSVDYGKYCERKRNKKA